jgi:hypothetical protein
MANKLKIAKTGKDLFVSPILINGNPIGGTGGDTGIAGNQIQGACKIGSNAAAACWLVRQKGASKFLVQDANTNRGICTLVNKAQGTLAAGEMSIAVTTQSSTVYASRITNKFVHDFAGNKYRYWFSAPTATFVQVANA